jgi:predicted RNA-binding Zn ribbon-like protein
VSAETLTAETDNVPAEPGRFGLAPAPGGLRLVQDLVNTALAERAGVPQAGVSQADVLMEPGGARAWLGRALEAWSAATGIPAPAIDLDQSDLEPLRDHRELLRAALRPGSAGPGEPMSPSREIAARALLTVGADGRVRYEPLESGWRAVRALTSIEILLAQTAGTWPRLKTCAYRPCGACFYDSSPNRARVWHDTKMCGNISNLRASRARKRAGG